MIAVVACCYMVHGTGLVKSCNYRKSSKNVV